MTRRSPCRTIVLAAAAVACMGVSAGCTSSRSGDDSTGPSPAIAGVVPRATGDVPFERTWDLELGKQVEKSWIGQQLPSSVFFQLAGTHEIQCIDTASGNTRWITPPLPKQVLGEPFVQHLELPGEREKEVRVEDRLFFICDDILYCYDIGSGQRIWEYPLSFAPCSGPLAVGVAADLRVFIGDWDDRVQVVGIIPDKSFPYIAWQQNLGAAIFSSGIESEDQCYFGDSKGDIHCFKLDRVEIWKAQTGGAIDGGVAVRDRVLYAGTASNAVHAINRLTGERLGQFNLQAPVRRRPFWFNGESQRLYVWTDSPDPAFGGLAALRVQSDNIAYADPAKHALEVVRMGQDWYLPGARRLVASTPLDLIVSGSDPSLLWAVHRGTGKVEWTWKVDQGWPAGKNGKASIQHIVTYQDPTDQLRAVIAVDDNGHTAAFRVYDFVPTPEQQAKGITSRALAGQPAPAKPAEKADKPKKGKDDKKADKADDKKADEAKPAAK